MPLQAKFALLLLAEPAGMDAIIVSASTPLQANLDSYYLQLFACMLMRNKNETIVAHSSFSRNANACWKIDLGRCYAPTKQPCRS